MKMSKRKKCESRCDTWFFNTPELVTVCKSACRDNPDISRDDLLCSGSYISEFDFMQQYGYDPCPGKGMTLDQFRAIQAQMEPTPPPAPPPIIPPANQNPAPPADTPGEAGANEDKKESWVIYAVGGAVLLVVALLLFIKKK